MRPVHEFGPKIRAVVETSDKAGFLGSADIEALVAEWSAKIAAARDASVAAALNAQAEFYWEASTLLAPTRAVAESTGEESMTAVLDAQIRTMQEVSARLRRRAAQFQGVSAEDQAIHEMAAGKPVATGPFFERLDKSLHATFNDLVAAYLVDHPDLDPKKTSFDFINGGEEGWRIAGHKVVEESGAPDEAIALGGPEGEACCSCCAVNDGRRLCYCNNSGKPKAKWCKCGPCKEARDAGRLADEPPK